MKFLGYSYCLFLFLLFSTQAVAQSWFRTSDHSILEIGEQVIQTADQGYLISGKITTEAQDSGRLFKLNASGDLEWWSGAQYSSITDLLAVDDGRLFAAGQLDDDPNYNAIVVGYNSDGSVIWEKNLGIAAFPDVDLSSNATTYGLISTRDNNLLHYGSFRNPQNIDGPTFGIITKLDYAGNEIWTMDVVVSDTSILIREIFENDNEELVFTASSSSDKTLTGKIDSNGNLIWLREINFSEPTGYQHLRNGSEFVTKLIPTPDGSAVLGRSFNSDTIFVGNDFTISDFWLSFIGIFDGNGNLIYSEIIEDVHTNTADIVMDNNNLIYAARRYENWGNDIVYKGFDNLGGFVFDVLIPSDKPAISDVKLFSIDNELIIFGTSFLENTFGDFNTINLTKTSSTGQFISRRETRIPNSARLRAKDVEKTSDGGFVLTGYYNYPSALEEYILHVTKIDSEGYLFGNNIAGQVFTNLDDNCDLESTSSFLERIMMVAEGAIDFFGFSNGDGEFSIDVDSGNYELSVIAPNEYWVPCDTFDLSLGSGVDSTIYNLGLKPIVDCPFLEVDVATPFLRRCFENTYYVQYCNSGTADANDVYIEVEFDQYLTVDSASIPVVSNQDQLYTFDIGYLPVGACDEFKIYTTLDCSSTVTGQTHCVEAHIFPDSLCIVPDSIWSGASIELDAICDADSVIFEIENVGTAPTTNALDYVIIVDDVVLRVANFTLEPLETLTFSEYAGNSTVRLESEQEPGHPGNSQPSVTVQGCSSNDSLSVGFVSLFGQDDNNSFNSINCTESRSSFDPNDKRGFPLGFSSEHFISADQLLNYSIRFQNTGTDTAFNVVILDTLPATLDPTSIRLGASSHDYNFSIIGNGILRFDFPNILLPDSTVNQIASNGFVNFKISQVDGNSPLTEINNRAGIYFDFNEVVLTEFAFHTIEKLRLFGSDTITICAGEEFQGKIIEVDTFCTIVENYIEYDSIYTIYFDVEDEIITTLNVAINSDEPYQGAFYDADTVLYDLFTASNFCDSLVVTNIMVTLVDVKNITDNLNEIQFFPNPTMGFLNIQSQHTSVNKLRFFNSAGLMVYEKTEITGLPIDISMFASGIYLVEIEMANFKMYRRIIKY